MSKVINLFGGAGAGKSVLAAEVYVEMKKRGLKAELVREYVKQWAYEGRKVGTFDQFYLVGKQIRNESFLYGKVDYIVTDCPIWLGAVYETLYEGTTYIEKHVSNFTEFSGTKGVQYYNFLLTRLFPYDPVGRYQTEYESIQVDGLMKDLLERNQLNYQILNMAPSERAEFVIDFVTK